MHRICASNQIVILTYHQATNSLYDGRALQEAAKLSETPAVVQVLLDAGADPKARTKDGSIAWDLIPDDSPLRDSDVYWQLNDARF